MEQEENLNGAESVPEATEEIKEPRVILSEKTLTPREKKIRTAFRWVFINIGALMMASSVYFFQVQNNFTLGGMAGISILLSSVITPLVPFLTQAVIMVIINVILLIIGFIILGKQCTFRTIYCSLVYTGLIWLFERVLPLEHPLTFNPDTGLSQPFLELCYAILLFGAGGALIFNCGASSGGTDIIALILKKYTSLNVGVALMVVDLLVVIISIFTFKDATTMMYSFLGLFARTFLLDGVIESMSKTKYITIITKKHDEIAGFILKQMNHSFTVFDAEGGYTGEKKKVMITICKRGEALKLKSKVKAFDPEAFVIITDANEILGKGFGGTF